MYTYTQHGIIHDIQTLTHVYFGNVDFLGTFACHWYNLINQIKKIMSHITTCTNHKVFPRISLFLRFFSVFLTLFFACFDSRTLIKNTVHVNMYSILDTRNIVNTFTNPVFKNVSVKNLHSHDTRLSELIVQNIDVDKLNVDEDITCFFDNMMLDGNLYVQGLVNVYQDTHAHQLKSHAIESNNMIIHHNSVLGSFRGDDNSYIEIENVHVRGDLIINQGIDVHGILTSETINALNDAIFEGNVWIDNKLVVDGLMVAGPALFDDTVNINNKLHAKYTMSVFGGAQFNQSVYVDQTLHLSDLNVFSNFISAVPINVDQSWACSQNIHVIGNQSTDDTLQKNKTDDMRTLCTHFDSKVNLKGSLSVKQGFELISHGMTIQNSSFEQYKGCIKINRETLNLNVNMDRVDDTNNIKPIALLQNHSRQPRTIQMVEMLNTDMSDTKGIYMTFNQQVKSIHFINNDNNCLSNALDSSLLPMVDQQMSLGISHTNTIDNARFNMYDHVNVTEMTTHDKDSTHTVKKMVILTYDVHDNQLIFPNYLMNDTPVTSICDENISLLLNSVSREQHIYNVANASDMIDTGFAIARIDIQPSDVTTNLPDSVLFHDVQKKRLVMGNEIGREIITSNTINQTEYRQALLDTSGVRLFELDSQERRTSRVGLRFGNNTRVRIIQNGHFLVAKLEGSREMSLPFIIGRDLIVETTLTLPPGFQVTPDEHTTFLPSACAVNTSVQRDLDAWMAISISGLVPTRQVLIRFGVSRQGTSSLVMDTLLFYGAQCKTFLK